MFQELVDVVPSYLADHIWEQKDEWMSKDMAETISKLEELRTNAQPLLDKYTRATVDSDSDFRQAYRRDHPDIDAALLFWKGYVNSYGGIKILKQKADSLGLSYELFPALNRKTRGTKLKPTDVSKIIEQLR